MRSFILIAALMMSVLSIACERADVPATSVLSLSRPEPAAVGPITVHESFRPPAQLKLTAVDGEDGELVLVAQAEIVGRLPGEPILRVSLPEDAYLIEGVEEQTIFEVGPKAQFQRRFVIHYTGGVVRVTLDASSVSHGIHLERSYPEQPPEAGQRVREPVSIVPITVNGIQIDKAIPLRANQD